jgi:hypothetical protein
MTLNDVMTPGVEGLSPEATCQQAADPYRFRANLVKIEKPHGSICAYIFPHFNQL